MLNYKIIDVEKESMVKSPHFTYCAVSNIDQVVSEHAKQFDIEITTVYRQIKPSGRCSIYLLVPEKREQWSAYPS
jgi:hypothetical protein